MSSAARRKASCASTVRETVLRDGLATDGHDPAGVYFGTRSGKIYGSADEGNTWRLLADGLPGVVCVKAAVIGPAA